MFPNSSFPERQKPVMLLKPATDAAGRTGKYVSLKLALGKAWILVSIDQGNAATILLSLLQATSVAGGGSKVLTNVVPIWANLDTDASDTLLARTAAVNYTTDAGVKPKQVMFEIDTTKLDVAGGFDCVGLSTGASNVANVTFAEVFPSIRYPSATPPSMIVD